MTTVRYKWLRAPDLNLRHSGYEAYDPPNAAKLESGAGLPAAQAMFRSLCRKALKGDNAALRRVIDLMLTLEPVALQQAEQNTNQKDEAWRDFVRRCGRDPDAISDRPRKPSPMMERINKQAAAMAKEERKRLIRKYRDRQRGRY